MAKFYIKLRKSRKPVLKLFKRALVVKETEPVFVAAAVDDFIHFGAETGRVDSIEPHCGCKPREVETIHYPLFDTPVDMMKITEDKI